MISHAVILCGGSGTRMREAGYTQAKFLLPISDNFIGYLMIKNLKKFGINSVHLLLGERGEEIKNVIDSLETQFDLRISYSQESEPKGTGGALLSAIDVLPDEMLLLHGDLLLNTDLSQLVNIFDSSECDFAQIVHPSSHVFDSDLVEVDDRSQIIGYHTKPHSENLNIRNLGNAGVYAFKKRVLVGASYEGFKIDLDRELLPELVTNGFIGKAIRNRQFIRDVGTPERYERTINNLEAFNQAELLKPAIFLDRDGTINSLNGFIKNEAQIKLIEGVGQAVTKLNKSGFLVIVVTNQPVIARGETTLKELNNIHGRIEMELAKSGAVIDEIYFCPHHPDSGFDGEIPELKISCICRKPSPGLIEQACKDFQISLEKSWIIGDSWRDVHLGKNAGVRAIRVGTGEDQTADFNFQTLGLAVDFILDSPQAKGNS